MLHLWRTSILPPLCPLVLVTLPIIFYFLIKKYRALSKALLIPTILSIFPSENCYYPYPVTNRAATPPHTKSITISLSINYLRHHSCTQERRNNISLNDKSIKGSIFFPYSPYTTTKRKEKHGKKGESRTTRYTTTPNLLCPYCLATNLKPNCNLIACNREAQNKSE